MEQLAENFIPEYADVLCALIGAKFILFGGDPKETSQLVHNLFMHRVDNKFPIFKEMKNFYSNIWNANTYSRIYKLHYLVEHRNN